MFTVICRHFDFLEANIHESLVHSGVFLKCHCMIFQTEEGEKKPISCHILFGLLFGETLNTRPPRPLARCRFEFECRTFILSMHRSNRLEMVLNFQPMAVCCHL